MLVPYVRVSGYCRTIKVKIKTKEIKIEAVEEGDFRQSVKV